MSIWYGANVSDESELRLCGDLAGKRVIELGIAPSPNSILMAQQGAKAIALDPDPQAIAALRSTAERHEVRVECHQGDLADLGFATSGSVDLVVASHSLTGVDDLPRLLRQVHRVLKPGTPFIVAMPHPVAAMFSRRPQPAVRLRREQPHVQRAVSGVRSQQLPHRHDVRTERSTHPRPHRSVGAGDAGPQTGRLTRPRGRVSSARIRSRSTPPAAAARTGSPGRGRNRSHAAVPTGVVSRHLRRRPTGPASGRG